MSAVSGVAEHRRAVALLVTAALLWSLGGVLIKLMQWSPLAIASSRSALAALVLGLYLWRSRKCMPVILPRSVAGWGAALGYAATVVLFVFATKLTNAANAIVLQYTAPLHVALLSRFLVGERIRFYEGMVLAVMVGGVVLFFAQQLSPSGMLGNVLALGSGVAMAVMTLCVRSERQGQAVDALLTGNLLAAVVGSSWWHELPQLPLQTLVVLLVLGIVQLGIPYILFATALRSVRAIEASILTMLEPIANPLWVALVIGEYPSIWSLLGGALVLGALMASLVLRAQYNYASDISSSRRR